MAPATRSVRLRREPLKQALAATTRALAGRAGLSVAFTPDAAVTPDGGIRLPLPPDPPTRADIERLRGTADQLALTVRYHDSHLHAALSPPGGPARLLYEWAENARIATLGGRRWPGVRKNLEALLEQQCQQATMDGITTEDREALPLAVGLYLRQQLTGRMLPEPARRLVGLWEEDLHNRAHPYLPALERALGHQHAYGRTCLALIAALGLEAPALPPKAPALTHLQMESPPSDPAPSGDHGHGRDTFSIDPSRNDADPGAEAGSDSAGNTPTRPDWHDRCATAPAPEQTHRYRVYTQAYDREDLAEALCTSDELRGLREMLNRHASGLRQQVARLASRLEQLVMAHRASAWEGGLDQGYLDSGRLASLIAAPDGSTAFRRARPVPQRDTAITLLLDCSGSMLGKPIATAAICCDLIGRALERCGISTEVLGYTTRDWYGGEAHRRWLDAGAPSDPGRLNALRHLVIKTMDDPWRRASKNLGLLLQDGLLKENVDGEALAWAYRRLRARRERRRILLVISDGMPADACTDRHNRAGFLEAHLQQVTRQIERDTDVELLAIGIGHDVTRHYRRATVIETSGQLGTALVQQLLGLFTRSGPARGTTAPSGR